MVPKHVVIAPPVWDATSAIGIGGIAFIVAILWVFLYSHTPRRRMFMAGIAMLAMSLSAGLAFSGVLSRFDFMPPPMAIMIVSVFAMAFGFGFSSWGKDAAVHCSFAVLVGLQSFRLPLELFMHHAGNLKIMPVELSYGGYNFDIGTGLGALIILIMYLAKRDVPRWALWAWNIYGTLCLVAITIIALTTSPMVRLFGDTKGHVNTWVLYFPYVWLPVVLVTIAVLTHVVVWRKLLSTPASQG